METLAEAFESNRELIESIAIPDVIDTREFMRDTPGFFPSGGMLSASQIYDRDDGRYRPVYQHEFDLKMIRAMSWMLTERVPMAQAWVNRLLDYTIGAGYDWSIKHENKDVQRLASALITQTFDDNDWVSGLERESYAREVADGEFIASIEYHNGSVEINVKEGDELTEPVNARDLEDYYDVDFDASWSFGVLSPRYKPHKAVRYHFVADQNGNDWDCVPAWRVAHWKRNVRTGAKRGVSDFYKPHVYLLRADKVFTNTAHGAATQAAIAFIVEHAPGTTVKQAASLLSMTRLVQREGRTTSNTVEKSQEIRPGTRIETSAGSKYHAGLLGSNNSQIYIEVMESGLRMAGTVHAFPEGMLTGTYQNNNRSSSETAENPWKQGRLAEQNERARRVKQLIIKVLKLYAEHGAFVRFGFDDWNALRMGLEVAIQPARVFPDDPKALTEALAMQKTNGWVSDQTAVTELGRDYEAEQALIKKQGPAPRQIGQPPEPNGSQFGESVERFVEERIRCPAGFTKANPLIINGRSYIGGVYIPDVTKQEVDAAVKRQSAKANASLSPERLRLSQDRARKMIASRGEEGALHLSSMYLPVARDASALSENFSALNSEIEQNGKLVTIPMSSTNMTTFVASRTNLSSDFLMDAVNSGQNQSVVNLVKRTDGTYTIIKGSQNVIATQMLGLPTLKARVITQEQADLVIANSRAPVAAPPVAAPPAVQAASSVVSPAQSSGSLVMAPGASPTFNHSPTSVGAWMGVNGWSAADARRVMQARGVTESQIRSSTYATLLSRGRTGRGVVAPLTESEAAELNAWRAQTGAVTQPRSRSGIVAPAPLPAARPAPARPPYPVRNANESDYEWQSRQKTWIDTHVPAVPRNDPRNPVVEVNMRTPAQAAEVANGLRDAKARVRAIERADVSGLKAMPRVDTSSLRIRHQQGTSQFMRDHGARLTGAMPGSVVEIDDTSLATVDGRRYNKTRVTVNGDHGLHMERYVYEPLDGGKGFIKNSYFRLSDDAPRGHGLKAFASQVNEAKLLGFEKIKVDAAGEGNHRTGAYPGRMNGYYTWPRFGYAGDLSYQDGVDTGEHNLPMRLRGATRIEHLMTDADGREWMRLNGQGASYEFDLSDGSYSWNTIRQYYDKETRDAS